MANILKPFSLILDQMIKSFSSLKKCTIDREILSVINRLKNNMFLSKICFNVISNKTCCFPFNIKMTVICIFVNMVGTELLKHCAMYRLNMRYTYALSADASRTSEFSMMTPRIVSTELEGKKCQ
jgi:hypothetical protein